MVRDIVYGAICMPRIRDSFQDFGKNLLLLAGFQDAHRTL